ncbi:MAG TPA: hypothetical protein VFS05_00450 [Gemmatimonadaceae bacterium]|nr:hypothetical protein [Gemmatimonadaceae bacterium]
MSTPAYPTARAAAEVIASTLGKHIAAAAGRGERNELDVTPLPEAEAIAALVDAAFWASLHREEGRSPRISLALVPPELAGEPMMLARPLPLFPESLAHLAPAVERPGIHLGVWTGRGGLAVWGATRHIPARTLVVEVVEPGLLVAKHRRDEEGKFINMAVLRAGELQLVDERSARLPECPELLASLLGFETPGSWMEPDNALVQLALSMRRHGRGGALLLVPAGSDAWQESIVRPVSYAMSPAYTALARLLRDAPGDGDDLASAVRQESLRQRVDEIAGLTAVDGAAVMTDGYALLAFGAKIVRREGCGAVEQVLVTTPIVGSTPVVVTPSQLGGTRHLSAAQFVSDQRGAMGLVASQDGRFTVFVWSAREGMVQAHRLEALLL